MDAPRPLPRRPTRLAPRSRTTRGSRRVLVGAGRRSDRAAAGTLADDHRARIRTHPEPRRRPLRQRGVRDPATDDAPRVVAEPIPSCRRVRGDRRDATTVRAAPRDVSPTERRAARPVGGRRLSAFSPGSPRGPSPDLRRGELPSAVWRRRPSSARPLGSPSRPARCPRPLPHRGGRKRGVARPRGRAVTDCGPCSRSGRVPSLPNEGSLRARVLPGHGGRQARRGDPAALSRSPRSLRGWRAPARRPSLWPAPV